MITHQASMEPAGFTVFKSYTYQKWQLQSSL